MPLSGMTGFARVEGAAGAWSWAVEARSVNGRNLETRFRGPPGFDALERLAREAAQARFQRGQLTVNLHAKRSDRGGRYRIDQAQLDWLIAAAAPLVRSGQVGPPSFDGLLRAPGVLQEVEEGDDADAHAGIAAAMAVSVDACLEALLGSRREEGAALAPVLAGLVERIETLVADADAEAATQPQVLKARFARRMAELMGDSGGAGEERIVQEAAALAVRADVREELDRLRSHVAGARALLAADAASGRRLDFLAQEFMREANTLCSKSALSSLTSIGLDLKASVEQFREQVQNVE